VARGRAPSPAAGTGDDAGGHRRRNRCVRLRLHRLVRHRRGRSRAVGRDAGAHPGDCGDPGARGRCHSSSPARRIGRRCLALARRPPHPGPGGRRTRDPPRASPGCSRPHAAGLLGPARRQDRGRPLVPRDRPAGQHLPVPRGHLRGVRDCGIPPGGSRGDSRDLPGRPRRLPPQGGHLPRRRHHAAQPHRGGVPPRQGAAPPRRGCRGHGAPEAPAPAGEAVPRPIRIGFHTAVR
jgi:hypothetical protein